MNYHKDKKMSKDKFITCFVLPDLPNLRTWKFVDKMGNWISFDKHHIANDRNLRYFIKKFNPVMIFAGTCLWQGKRFLLGSPHVVFDIDAKYLMCARKLCFKIIKIMAYEGYELDEIRFTGYRGFNLLFKDHMKYKEVLPNKRLKEFVENRKVLLRLMPKSKLLDEAITLDPHRVIKIPGSLSNKSGKKCIVIPESVFHCPKELKAMTSEVYFEPHIMNIGVNRTGLRFAPPYHYYVVSNRLNGVNNLFVPVIIKRKHASNKILVDKVREVYDLKFFYHFQTHDMDLFLCLKPLSFERCKKVLKAAKSLNYDKFVKDEQIFFRVSPFIDKWNKRHSVVCLKGYIGHDSLDTISHGHYKIVCNLSSAGVCFDNDKTVRVGKPLCLAEIIKKK